MNRLADPVLMQRSSADWAARNQAWLARRFALWRERLQAPTPRAADAPPDGGPCYDEGFEPAAWHVARKFGLSTFERELLVLAAGVEIDKGLRDALEAMRETTGGEPLRIEFSLALALLPDAHWDALSPLAPLRHWSMLGVDISRGFLGARLRIDERMLHYLTGVAAADERLAGIAGFDDSPVEPMPEAERIAQQLCSVRCTLALLIAPASDVADAATASRAGRSLARAACAQLGLKLLWVDAAGLAVATGGDPRAIADIARALDREAMLEGGAIGLAIDADSAAAPSIVRLLGASQARALVVGALSAAQLAVLPKRKPLRFAIPKAAPPSLAALPVALRRDAAEALRQFHVEPATVEQAIDSVLGGAGHGASGGALWNALRESARGGLDTLAQRVESRATFADLVVPPQVATQLREIASQLRHRDRVYREWGFADGQARGLGIAALFAGESGTGKTLAAEAIANEAGLDLYRIDLAHLVSKYIGETEKNLSRLFAAAQASGAVLLFDEADALFGKRSEVKDSHDRYANIEVAYLLQRIESYRGLAILTTNLKSALDRAFLRRIRFVVHFPFPDEAARVQIWQRQFPAKAPLADVDFAALARMQLSGGHIRTVALNAAFHAAQRGEAIGPRALQTAARAEFAKLERTHHGSGLEAKGQR